jgi:hypothetical protein
MNDKRTEAVVLAVHDRHRDELVKTFNAVGSGVGKESSADDSFMIVVYLRSSRDAPSEPVLVEDVPLSFIVTGEIQRQSTSRS